MLVQASIREELIKVAIEYLGKMREGDFDYIWHNMLTLEAAKLLSTALLPANFYKEGRIEEVLTAIPQGDKSVPLDQAFAVGFQMDIEKVRSQFFGGMARAMAQYGWLDTSLENSNAFADDSAAVLIDDSLSPPMMIFFVRRPDGSHKVDFEAFLLFSMQITASALYNIGNKAIELGQPKTAISYFELSASFSDCYNRIRRLALDHLVVSQVITRARKQELLDEENYILLARHQVLTLLSNPQVRSQPLNMADFLERTFKGYDKIPETDLDQSEIDRLNELNDEELRKAIASILNGVNPVVALREAKKPHGPHEISDMELLVRHENELNRLSMPIKSGREIQSNTVPVSIAYQIIRPFLYFPDGVVVFITAKPCSQHLHNYIKAANDILGFSIEVIEHEELGKLLKVNGQL